MQRMGDGLRQVFKLYDTLLQQACAQTGLTRTEADVLAFLYHHPGCDTAGEIVELRQLPKANVSQAVELLIGRGMLTRRTDAQDRRRVHLQLTDEAQKVLPPLLGAQDHFEQALLRDIPAQQRALLGTLFGRITENARTERERVLQDGKK